MTFIRYISSAGSGKTYTLVREYLKIALREKGRYKKILAITFTNKAAAEMKDRILTSLQSLSKGENKNLELEIAEDTGMTSITKKSKRVLTAILHDYSNFSVMTIDSFFLRLLRAFSYEENIPAGFDVELDMEKISDVILKKVYDQFGRDRELTEIVLDFIISKIKAQKSFNIEKDLLKLESEIVNEKWNERSENLKEIEHAELRPALNKLKKIFIPFIESMNKYGREFKKMVSDAGLKIDNFSYKAKGIAGTFVKAEKLSFSGLKAFKPGKRFISDNWIAAKTPREISEKIELLLHSGLQTLKNRMEDFYNGEFSKAVSAYVIYENLNLLALNSWISAFIDNYSSENRIIPISEFNKKIYSIVKEGDIPFIYSILGNRFSNILIDEFQDTSKMQWDCLFPLIENSLSEGNKCLAVGDSKQSIYRWRGGDLDILLRGIQRKILPENLKTVDLKTNFRSLKNIVKFNNELFLSLKSLDGSNADLLKIFEDPAQSPARDEGGFVSVDFVGKNGAGEDHNELFLRLEEIIGSITDAGFAEGDITILTRKNSESVKTAEYLLEKGYPVISPDSLKLFRSPLCRFIMNLLKILFSPDDKLLIAEILYFMKKYGKNISEKISTEISGSENGKIFLPKILTDYLAKRSLYKRLPAYEAVEGIIRRFKLSDKTNFETGGLILSFLDMTKKYSEEKGGDLSGFFDWSEINGDKFLIPGSGAVNGISIMTIHKAKGLQFNCVIIPFANWKYKSSDKMIWVEPDPDIKLDLPGGPKYYVKSHEVLERSLFSGSWKDEESQIIIDNINLLYVACTRAVESLSILCAKPSSKEKISNAGILYDAVKNMDLIREVSEDERYEIGMLKKLAVGNKNEEIFEVPFISLPWSGRVTIVRKITDPDILLSSSLKTKIAIGNTVHKILSEISSIEKKDEIVEINLKTAGLDKSSVETVKKMVDNVLNDRACEGWFDGGSRIHNERDILFEGKNYRPDKMILDDENATVIDFKTGEKNEKNREQVKKYIRLLYGAGYRSVRGILYYIENCEIEEVKTDEK